MIQRFSILSGLPMIGQNEITALGSAQEQSTKQPPSLSPPFPHSYSFPHFPISNHHTYTTQTKNDLPNNLFLPNSLHNNRLRHPNSILQHHRHSHSHRPDNYPRRILQYNPPMAHGDYHHRCNSVRMCGCLHYGCGGAGLARSGEGEGGEEEEENAGAGVWVFWIWG